MLGTYPAIMPFSLEDADLVTIILAVMVAPFVEELAKPLGLYFVGHEERPDFNMRDWALLGAMAGLGFAVVENFLYAATVLSYGPDVSIWLLGLRFLLPLHVLATAVSGYGFGLWSKTGNAKYFAACISVSMLLHGVFNLAASVVG